MTTVVEPAVLAAALLANEAHEHEIYAQHIEWLEKEQARAGYPIVFKPVSAYVEMFSEAVMRVDMGDYGAAVREADPEAGPTATIPALAVVYLYDLAAYVA